MNEELTLRDKFAIEVLSCLISDEGNKRYFIIQDQLKLKPYLIPSELEMIERANNYMENCCRAAYKIADIMRKIRLTAFE